MGVERQTARHDWLHSDRRTRAIRGAESRSAGDELLAAPRIFVNVGGRASVPDIPGVHDVPFLNNRSILELDRLPEHLVVVGGSYVGLEFAQMYRRFGAEVTVVEKSPHLIARETRRSRKRYARF
jgi:pyruvate/2-oxoglutarate dehydrogenase complex dihydrolipoamide dehydrogenase (E3) component